LGGYLVAVGGLLSVLFSAYLAILMLKGLPQGNNVPSGLAYLFSSRDVPTTNDWCPYCVGMYGFNLLVLVGGYLWVKGTEGGNFTNALTGNEDSSMGAMSAIFFVVVILGSFPLFSEPEWNMEELDVEIEIKVPKKSKILGNPDAAITVVEFIDFRCGHCAEAAPVEKHADNVRLVQRNFPLSGCPVEAEAVLSTSCLLGVAVECASLQGKFWELSSLIFSEQRSFSRVEAGDDFRPLISNLGLREDSFVECVDDLDMVEFVKKDLKLAEKYRVIGTPAVFIHGLDGKRWFKIKNWDSLDKIITKSLAGEVPPADLGTSE
jgi:protein-disulfide isomerase